MQVFTYKAKSKDGDMQTGIVEAETEDAAAAIVTARNLFPVDITSESKKDFSFLNRISPRDKTFLARQLSTMITAGLPIAESLITIQEQTNKSSLRVILQEVTSDVEAGSTLSSSFAKHPKLFSPIDLTIIASGEKSGTLDIALKRIADRLEKDLAMMRKVRSALVYPAAVLVVTLAVLILMLIFVMPQMEELYKSFDADLPLPTRIMIGLSHAVGTFFPVFIAMIVALGVSIKYYFKTNNGKHLWAKTKITVPGFGALMKMLYSSRFSRTLSTLIASGVPILDALNITSQAVGNIVYSEAILKASENVKGGIPLSASLKEAGLFPPVVFEMVSVGEKTGELDNMLEKLAIYFEEEVDTAVKNISELIMPALIIVLGILIAGVVVSSIYPIYNITSLTK